jgi:hypothetical protein
MTFTLACTLDDLEGAGLAIDTINLGNGGGERSTIDVGIMANVVFKKKDLAPYANVRMDCEYGKYAEKQSKR